MKIFSSKELLLLVTPLLLFAILTTLVFSKIILPLDNYVYQVVSSLITPWFTQINIAVSWLGDAPFMIPFLIVLFLYHKTRILFFKPAVLTCVLSFLLNRTIKLILERPRPDINRLVEVSHFSFPSGHAMNNMALYTILVLLICHYAKNNSTKIYSAFVAYAFILFVGFSRVYLGVHYFSDIIAGYLLGFVVAFFVFLLKKNFSS